MPALFTQHSQRQHLLDAQSREFNLNNTMIILETLIGCFLQSRSLHMLIHFILPAPRATAAAPALMGGEGVDFPAPGKGRIVA